MNRHLTTAGSMLVLLALVFWVAAPAVVRGAITLDNILDGTSGLSGFCPQGDTDCAQAAQDICIAGNIADQLQQWQDGWKERVLDDLKKDFQDNWAVMIFRLAACIPGSAHYLGSGPGAQNCSTDIGGTMATQMKNQYMDKMRADVMDGCLANKSNQNSTDAARAVIAQNGRDGGPAFVTDWRTFQAQSRYRGLQVARNQMANTNFCPWLQGPMQGYFNFDVDGAVDVTGEYEDGMFSYRNQAACTFDEDFNVFADENQSTATLEAILANPQNNIWGASLMAQENIQQQVEAEEVADEREFVQTGGLGALREIDSSTGTSCITFAADGSTCLKYGSIKNPSGGVQAEVNAARNAEYAAALQEGANASGVAQRIVSGMLDYTQNALGTTYSLSGGQSDVVRNPQLSFRPRPTADPADPSQDPVCRDQNPNCTCVQQDASTWEGMAQIVKMATDQAVEDAPLFSPVYSLDKSGVMPGAELLFLIDVCNTDTLSPYPCTPTMFSSGTGISDSISFNPGGIDVVVQVLGPVNPAGFRPILSPGNVKRICFSE